MPPSAAVRSGNKVRPVFIYKDNTPKLNRATTLAYLVSRKRSFMLSAQQKSILVSSGMLTYHGRGASAGFEYTHKTVKKGPYIRHLYEKFKAVVNTAPVIREQSSHRLFLICHRESYIGLATFPLPHDLFDV